jgi:hypothetical protein
VVLIKPISRYTAARRDSLKEPDLWQAAPIDAQKFQLKVDAWRKI